MCIRDRHGTYVRELCIDENIRQPEQHAVVVRSGSRPNVCLGPSVLPVERIRAEGAAGIAKTQRTQVECFTAAFVVFKHGIGKVVIFERLGIRRVSLGRLGHRFRRSCFHPSRKSAGQKLSLIHI